MTLTLSQEIERTLTEEAARRGMTPEGLVEQAVREKYAPVLEGAAERRKRVYALMGSSSHLGPSRILDDEAEEIRREERRWQP